MTGRIIITGATGFVGRHVFSALTQAENRPILCASRDPAGARHRYPDRTWVHLDVDDPNSIEDLLQEGDRILFLVHAMADGEGYAEREAAAAQAFGRIAKEVGVARIVYLGGPKPVGRPSKHLASRLRTGETLRACGLPTIELRAGMVLGHGSESWRITRDLAARLPVMLLPRWLRHMGEPVAIRDVVAALIHALDAPEELAGPWDLPGPDRLTYKDVLYRVAAQGGTRPFGIPVPLLTPRLSSHWLRLVTRANMDVARELVDGLHHDLVTEGDGYFENMPEYKRTLFETAVRLALQADARNLPLRTRLVEGIIKRLSRSSP
jgi:uncharacterized protein YbjT (DUF2867 family)